jgi:vacuolar-type H+-ATPase subunit I/STV1
MGSNQPLSPTTRLGKNLAAGRKLASLCLVQGLLRSIPGLPTAALAGVVIVFFTWSCERQARRRDTLEAQQVKKQAAEEISRLQQQAAGALRDAKQSTQAVRELESQQQQFVREAEGLRQSLESLRKQELARANEVATLPTSEVVSRVASRLEEQVSGVRDQVSGQQKQVSGVGGQGSGIAPNASPPSSPALVLSDAGARKVETAFVELDSCRQQAQVMGQQVSNCEQQAKLNSAIVDQQSGTIAKLNAALADKDQVLARSEEAHRAELKAARGTWRSRFFRAVEIFAGGFIAGVLVR